MNSSLIAKRSNIHFFIAAAVVSMAMLAAGGLLLNKIVSGQPDKYTQVAQKSCVTNLQSRGFFADVSKPGEIKASRANDQVEALVFQSSVLIASCPAYTLNDFCAGAVCQTPGVTFTLKNKEL